MAVAAGFDSTQGFIVSCIVSKLKYRERVITDRDAVGRQTSRFIEIGYPSHILCPFRSGIMMCALPRYSYRLAFELNDFTDNLRMEYVH